MWTCAECGRKKARSGFRSMIDWERPTCKVYLGDEEEKRGEYVVPDLDDLAERHAADTWFTRTTAKIHPRPECIRQRVQKIMNTMCGRRNIDQIMCAG